MMQYIVKKGDTVGRISSSVYGSTNRSGEIVQINALKNPNLILEGQTLLLPEKEKSILNKPEESDSTTYKVKYGDSLSAISQRYLGSGDKWKEIANLNGISQPDHIFVGQVLKLPLSAHPVSASIPLPLSPLRRERYPAKHIPARSFVFIIGDEFLPGRKVVRKVLFPHKIQNNPELVRQIIKPEKYGIKPIQPGSKIPVGRHVLGMTNSKYISASERLLGSPRFEGKRYWINTKKVKQAGGTIHEGAVIAKDLERIAKKTKDPKFLEYIKEITYKSGVIDKEVLIEGSIPAGAVKGALAEGLTHGFRVATVVGMVISIHDLSEALDESIETNSIKPFSEETLRQAGGWAGALAGAKIGASAGALVGIETGPGALLTGAAGGFIFGAAGYIGADWLTEFIENEVENGYR